MGAMNEVKERIPDLESVIRMRMYRAFDDGSKYMLDSAMAIFGESQREQWTKGEIIEELRALRGKKA